MQEHVDLYDTQQQVFMNDPYTVTAPEAAARVQVGIPCAYGVVEFNIAHDPEATRSFLRDAVLAGFRADPTALLECAPRQDSGRKEASLCNLTAFLFA